jgi:hypothetical protein
MNTSHLLALMAGLVVIGLNSSGISNSLPASGMNSTVQNAPGSANVQAVASRADVAKPAVEPIEMKVYPNPNLGYFVVQLPSSMEGKKGTIEVMNRGAKVVYSSDFAPENGNKVIVDMGTSDPGMYFLVIRTVDDRMMSKFLVS